MFIMLTRPRCARVRAYHGRRIRELGGRFHRQDHEVMRPRAVAVRGGEHGLGHGPRRLEHAGRGGDHGLGGGDQVPDHGVQDREVTAGKRGPVPGAHVCAAGLSPGGRRQMDHVRWLGGRRQRDDTRDSRLRTRLSRREQVDANGPGGVEIFGGLDSSGGNPWSGRVCLFPRYFNPGV